jgi:hypothetical protein
MATIPQVIPSSERFENLKGFLLGYVDIVAKIRDENPKLAQAFPLFFMFLMFPWLAPETQLSSEEKELVERRKHEMEKLNFDGLKAKKQLEEVLTKDKHLRECCPTLLHLANFS